MQLVITIRKDVPDSDEAREAYEFVKQHLQDRPDLIISGHFTNHFEPPPEPPIPG